MALSLTDDYNLTRDQLIRSAFEDIGVAIANEPLEPEDIAVASATLMPLALSWKAHGMQLWKRSTASLALVQGTNRYELTPTLGSGTEKPMRLLTVDRIETSSGNSVSVNRLSQQEWDNLPNETNQGLPINFYFEPLRTTSYINLWLTPSAIAASDYTISYTYSAPTQDMDVGNEDIDFPNEWYRALRLNLAVDLAPKYGLPARELILLKEKADEALELALSYDTEDTSVYFGLDHRGMR